MTLALLAAAQAAPPLADDIIVLARKMQLIHVSIRAPKHDGKLVLGSCKITRPSGIAELDAVPCAAAQACIAENPDTRKALLGCVEQHSQVQLDAIVARRREAHEVAQ
jgi:hypothetical protein